MGKPAKLAKGHLAALGRLRRIKSLERFYLGGGAAIASQLGHRRSLDLDLFSIEGTVDLDEVKLELLDAFPRIRVEAESKAVLRVSLGETLVDIVRYQYPPLSPPRPGPSGFLVASLRDLAAMKLAAIAGRGIRRDLWDLYEIARHGLRLRDAGRAYLQRYGASESNLYHVARALEYFDDAEKDPAFPSGLTRRKWEEIKRYFLAESPKLLEA